MSGAMPARVQSLCSGDPSSGHVTGTVLGAGARRPRRARLWEVMALKGISRGRFPRIHAMTE